MRRAIDQFNANVIYVDELGVLYDYLSETLRLPNDLSDILRAQLVYTVSALDKLIHELVRIGMIESFNGLRVKTDKYNSFSINLNTLSNIQTTTVPPPVYWFEQEIIQRHKSQSFQEPSKIADALSLIWDENHKWYKIALGLHLPENDVKVKLKNIINRRNQIVHESDIDPITGDRSSISKLETNDMIQFIKNISISIFTIVV